MNTGAERPIGLVLRTLLAIIGVAALARARLTGKSQSAVRESNPAPGSGAQDVSWESNPPLRPSRGQPLHGTAQT